MSKIKRGHMKVLLSSFHWNGHMLDFFIDFTLRFKGPSFGHDSLRALQHWKTKASLSCKPKQQQTREKHTRYSKIAAFKYSFVYFQISPCCLVLKREIQKNIFP